MAVTLSRIPAASVEFEKILVDTQSHVLVGFSLFSNKI